MRRRPSTLSAAGFLLGAVAGTFVWSRMRYNSRRRLFSRHPFQRFIALSHLSSRPTLETARLLRDYVRWENRTLLRDRGARLLRRIEARLEAAA